jgi:hypothetical protein
LFGNGGKISREKTLLVGPWCGFARQKNSIGGMAPTASLSGLFILSRNLDNQKALAGLFFHMNLKGKIKIPEGTCSIAEAAKFLGLDSFTVHSLIQRDKLRGEFAPWGEIVITQSELQRVVGGSTIGRREIPTE